MILFVSTVVLGPDHSQAAKKQKSILSEVLANTPEYNDDVAVTQAPIH